MPDLIAQGEQPQDRWRRSVPTRQKFVIGRAAPRWAVPWDRQISRNHVEAYFLRGRLHVRRLKNTTNPVFLKGKPEEEFFIKPGEHFVIGTTHFTFTSEQVYVTSHETSPVTEQSFSPQYLQRLRFRDAAQRIDVLARLPEIISGATSDSELHVRLVNVLMSGIPRASAAAIVSVRNAPTEGTPNVEVLHWDRRTLTGDNFHPSEQLILQAIEGGESVLHVWGGERDGPQFTEAEEIDWALCTPVGGLACRGWGIYVAGKFGGSFSSDTDGPQDLQDDLKFTELAANTLSSLRQLKVLERSHAVLRQFLSPVVLEAVGDSDWEQVLAPREADVAVLFCDLRGFSRESEKHADDLSNLLKRVSRALGVTTHHILDSGGVVGDFHGDAAMGFWGWPLPQHDAVARAALAALGIRAEFEAAARREGHPLRDFQIGVGIAAGRAVAGQIGTTDQVKVTAFGPVVNLASRLEGMTKFVRAPILIDSPTAAAVRETLSPDVARVRKVAIVRPYGLDSPIEVSELLPPAAEYSHLTDEHIQLFERAVDAMVSGDWATTFELLHKVPAEDRVKDFLTIYMAHHDRTPPPRWDGIIPLERK